MIAMEVNHKSVNVVTLEMIVNKEIIISESKINDSDIASDIFIREIGNKDREYFAILCLDSKGNATHFSVVHIGTLNQTIVHPREIYKLAILSNANSVIVGHNHPSGDTTPSKYDIDITNRLVTSGKLLNIPLLDHIIVSDKMSLSMRSKYSEVFN